MGIRFRLYCSERLRRERLLGESFASLKLLALDQLHREQQLIIQFEAPTGPFKVIRFPFITNISKLLINDLHPEEESVSVGSEYE